MSDGDEIEERLAHNIDDVMEHGPGLRIGRSTWIAAKDTVNGYVLKSGLGGMGVGSMWFPMHDAHVYEDGSRTPATSEDPTYDEAPDVLTRAVGDIYGLVMGGRDIIDPEQAKIAYRRTAAGMMLR